MKILHLVSSFGEIVGMIFFTKDLFRWKIGEVFENWVICETL